MVPHVIKANKNEYKDLNDKNIDYTWQGNNKTVANGVITEKVISKPTKSK